MKIRDIEITPFIADDLNSLTPRPFDNDWFDKCGEGVIADCGVLEEMGPAYTGWIEKKAIFCTGIRLLWHGVGEVWSIGDRYLAKRYAKEMFSWQLHLLNEEIRKRDFHRLQAHVLKKWKSACKYTERLGFKEEAVLKKFGPDGSDYILYVRVF